MGKKTRILFACCCGLQIALAVEAAIELNWGALLLALCGCGAYVAIVLSEIQFLQLQALGDEINEEARQFFKNWNDHEKLEISTKDTRN